MDDFTKKRFLWGVALAWVPWIPILIGLARAFLAVPNTKATGLTALAAGLAETFLLFGLAATLLCEVAALILLFRAFAHGHAFRSFLSVVSIGVSGLMILFFCFFLWLLWFQSHHVF